MNGLSGAVRRGDLVVLTAVVAERQGEGESVQVLVAESSVGAAVRSLRRSGYRDVGSIGSMSVDEPDADLAIADPGQIFEREWETTNEWLRVGRSAGGHG